MTCKQARYTAHPSEVRMEQIRDNLASFTAEEATSMRDYKDLKMSFKTRVKIWLKRFLVLPNF